MRATKAARLILAALAVLALSAPARAQVAGLDSEGWIEAGIRAYIDGPSKGERAKFEEYRDLPEWAFLQDFRLRLFKPDQSYSFEFEGSKWGQDDQEFLLRAGRLGLWRFDFEWDQTPHIFSTNARTLATEVSRGVYTLPTPRPGLNVHNNAARELSDIGVRWDTARFSLWLTPTPDLDFKIEYSRINKDGDRPFGMAFGSPGNDFVEILEPIEQTVHDVRLRAALARENYQVQFGYTLSVFSNSLGSVTFDNPRFGVGVEPERGRTALPPDNTAHTFSLGGGVSLPMRTRVNANVSYSLRLQNEEFLAHTINPALAPNVELVLPVRSLHGNVQIWLVNLQATSRPLPLPVTFSARYRLYDFADLSDEPTFPGHVVNDRTFEDEAVRALRAPYTKHNADLDGRWRIIRPVALTLGAGWERWDRDPKAREVTETDEVYGKAALDVTPFHWVLFRATYKPSFRRINRYSTYARLFNSLPVEVAEEEFATSQSTLLRKFDEGERDRHRVDGLLQLMLTDSFSTTLNGGYQFDDYIDSPLGLQEARSWSAGADFNWMPVQRVSVFGGYVHERIKQQQRSRNRDRTFVAPPTVFDFKDHEWVTENIDTIDTVHLGTKVALLPKVLDWNVGANYSYALGRVNTSNPIPPASGTAPQNANATPRAWPAQEDSLLRIETALRYHFWKVWTASLGYVFEEFQKNDWRTDQLNPFEPGVNSIWLGNDLKDYTAHIVGLTLAYRF